MFAFATTALLLTLTAPAVSETTPDPSVRYGTETVDGLDIFFREAGRAGAPQIVLLHGFPTSSHMFRDLIPRLAEDFHVIAPDYPGYGLSSAPSVDEFEYTFAGIASIVDTVLERRGFDRYALYLMDYGAPVGYRIAEAHPERVTGLVIQNGNAYDEGLREFWDPIKRFWESGSTEDGDALRGLLTLEATKWQYQHGTVALIHTMRDLGITALGNYTIGYPDETFDEMMETIMLAKRHMDEGLTAASFFVIVPFPGSNLFDMAIQGGHLSPDFNPDDMRWTKSIFQNTPVSAETLEAIRTLAWKLVNQSQFVQSKETTGFSSLIPAVGP